MWNNLIRLKSGIKNVKLKSGIKNGSRDGRKNQKKVSEKALKEYRHYSSCSRSRYRNMKNEHTLVPALETLSAIKKNSKIVNKAIR